MLCSRPLHVPASAELDATFPIDARLDYLVCTEEVCVPETATVTANLVVAAPRARQSGFPGLAPGAAAAARRRRDVRDGRRVGVRIAIPAPRGQRGGGSLFLPRHARRNRLFGGAERLAQRRHADRRDRGRAARRRPCRRSRACSQIGNGTAPRAHRPARRRCRPRGTPIGTTAAARSGGGDQAGGPSLLWALLGGAFLGGLILNLMPCVFPILSLKAIPLPGPGPARPGAARGARLYRRRSARLPRARRRRCWRLRAGGA